MSAKRISEDAKNVKSTLFLLTSIDTVSQLKLLFLVIILLVMPSLIYYSVGLDWSK